MAIYHDYDLYYLMLDRVAKLDVTLMSECKKIKESCQNDPYFSPILELNYHMCILTIAGISLNILKCLVLLSSSYAPLSPHLQYENTIYHERTS